MKGFVLPMVLAVILFVVLMTSGSAHQEKKPDMIAATVKHHDQVTPEQHQDEVELSCPEGYEGHFVDYQTGFGWEYWNGGTGFMLYERQPGYTICFSKEFMDKIRSNQELLRQRPAMPRPV